MPDSPDPYRTATVTLTAGEMDSLNACFVGEKTWNQPRAVFTLGGRNRIKDKMEHLRPGVQYPGTRWFQVDVAYHRELLARVLGKIDKELDEEVRGAAVDELPVDQPDPADRHHPDSDCAVEVVEAIDRPPWKT